MGNDSRARFEALQGFRRWLSITTWPPGEFAHQVAAWLGYVESEVQAAEAATIERLPCYDVHAEMAVTTCANYESEFGKPHPSPCPRCAALRALGEK